MLQKVNICGVDTSGLPKLSAEESDFLMRALKNGDERAREQFIVGNMRLVLSLVKHADVITPNLTEASILLPRRRKGIMHITSWNIRKGLLH